jgi:transcriptional regulator NrdR family protein
MKELLDNMQLSSAARAIARKIIEVCENVNDKLQTNLMQLARISQPNRLDKQLLEIINALDELNEVEFVRFDGAAYRVFDVPRIVADKITREVALMPLTLGLGETLMTESDLRGFTKEITNEKRT